MEYNRITFIIFMVLVPVGLIGVTGIIRSLTTNKTIMRHFYLGVDLGLAALSLAIISGIEPQARVMSTPDPAPQVKPPGVQISILPGGKTDIQAAKAESTEADSTSFIKKHSTGVAIFLDALLLFIAILSQMEFEKYCIRVPQPDKKQKRKEVILMLLLYNLIGIVTMVSTAYILRY